MWSRFSTAAAASGRLRTLHVNLANLRSAPELLLGLGQLRSLQELDLSLTSLSLRPGPCWAGLTRLSCRLYPPTDTLPHVLALATALEVLGLSGLTEVDAAASATLANLPALRHLGLPFCGCQGIA